MTETINEDVIQVHHELVVSTVANNSVSSKVQLTSDYVHSDAKENYDKNFSSANEVLLSMVDAAASKLNSPEVQLLSDYLPSEEEQHDENTYLDWSSATDDFASTSFTQKRGTFGTEFPCQYCSVSYNTWDNLRRHLNSKHAVLPRPEKASLQPETSKGCSAQTPNGTEFPCKWCNFSYKLIDSLKKHQLAKHHDDYVREEKRVNKLGVQMESSFGTEFPCAHCTNSYKLKKSLYAHFKSVHSEQKTPNEVYSCQFCTATFEIRESCMEHEKIMHKNAKERITEVSSILTPSVKCDYCPLFFKNGQGVKSHVKQKHPDMAALRIENASEVFSCSYCPKKYELFTSLQRHSQTVHNKQPKTPTTKTGSTITASVFSSRPEKKVNLASSPEDGKMNSNQESSHAEPLKCDKCDNEYSSLDFLNKHQLTHAPPVACYECGQVFKQVNQLKEHSTKCGKENSNDDMMKETYTQTSRKRGIDNVDNSRFPPVKRANFTEEPEVSIIGEETYEETSLEMQIKSEIRDSYEAEPSSFITNIIVPETFRVKQEPVEIISLPCTPLFTTPRAPQHQIQRAISRIPSSSPSILSDSTSVSQNLLNNSPSLNTSFSSNCIEKQALSLSAAIFTRSIQFPKELMVVWSNSLEEDLLAAVSMNSNNSILCVKELETMKIAKPQRDLLAKSQMVTFNMLDSNDTFTLWTVISFDPKNSQNGLKKKLFRSFVDVEKVLSEEAETKGMTISNIMRYSEDGIFPILSTSFSKKTMAFNYVE